MSPVQTYHTTLPVGVTNPKSDTFTLKEKNDCQTKDFGNKAQKLGVHSSKTVPLVITPNVVYRCDWGFFFTPRMSRKKVHFSSGWVTCAFLKRRPVGRMKRSYFKTQGNILHGPHTIERKTERNNELLGAFL